MAKNLCGKTRDVSKPYEIWEDARCGWTWKVLKKWQSPEKEMDNPYARWFCAVSSPITREQMSSGYEMGDVYVREITECAIRTYVDPSIEKGE